MLFVFLQFFNFVPQFHFVEGHQELDAVDDEADYELEPDKEGEETKEGAVGNAHAGYQGHAPAVDACHHQPQAGDQQSGDEGLAEGWRVGVRSEDVEEGEPHHQHHEGQGNAQNVPDGEEESRKVVALIKIIYDRIAEDRQSQGEENHHHQAEGEDDALGVDQHIVPVVPGHGLRMCVIQAVRGTGEDDQALHEAVQGEKACDPHPEGAAGGHDPVDVPHEGGRHAVRQVMGCHAVNSVYLRGHHEQHEIHREDQERQEAQQEIVGCA